MKEFLRNIHPLPNDILDEYLRCWKPYTTRRKSVITAPGEIEQYLYFVRSGVQKLYYEDPKRQHILAFSYEPSFSGVIESFFTQTPSRYFLEAITESEFLRISHVDHQRLLTKYREVETLFRKLTELFLLGMMQRHHELMAFDMQGRFRVFVKRSPHLLQMVSQKDLAAYLKMDSTNFSKLINNIRI